ncbi:MAG: glycosyltransferase family 2 protein [Myxococcales bacterium]|nr:glycosyltransferase family 2 protein [Myxococcales bacterium]
MLCDQAIAVVVPARNEQAHIQRVLRTMPTYVDHIIVVDDASTDATVARAASHPDPRVTVVCHACCTGVGGALATGYRLAFEQGAAVAGVMAGDGQMDPEDLEPVLTPVLTGRAEYAKGNRLGHPQVARDMPPLRLLGNRILSRMTRWATGLSIDDAQCGFTALSRRAYHTLDWARIWPGYGYPNDVLGWLSLAELLVEDVVVAPIYGQERSGVRLRHAVVIIPALLVRIAARRLLASTRKVAWVRLKKRSGATRPDESQNLSRALEPSGDGQASPGTVRLNM